MIKEKIGDLIIHDFPGGGIDFGESFEETLHREVMEEIGLKIKIGKLVGNWWFINSYKVHIVCMGYQCDLVGEAKIDTDHNPAGEEIFDAVWFSREELLADTENLLRADGMREAVENLVV